LNERRQEKSLRWCADDAYLLAPGYVYVSEQPVRLLAVVGICVAVCIWDRRLRRGGMNHYIYPQARDGARATPRTGDAAITALFRAMLGAGSAACDLEAWVFGGAVPEGAGRDIAEQARRNVEVARRMLAAKNVPLVSEDVGGSFGRKIIFDMQNGQAMVYKVRSLREQDWRPELLCAGH